VTDTPRYVTNTVPVEFFLTSWPPNGLVCRVLKRCRFRTGNGLLVEVDDMEHILYDGEWKEAHPLEILGQEAPDEAC